jgi:hypothetical protein
MLPKKPNVIRLDANGIAEATHSALSCADPSQSGKVFGETVERILQTTKADEMQASVGKRVCSVLSKLFPLMKLALGLTESVADVYSLCHNVNVKAGGFGIIKQTANGVAAVIEVQYSL